MSLSKTPPAQVTSLLFSISHWTNFNLWQDDKTKVKAILWIINIWNWSAGGVTRCFWRRNCISFHVFSYHIASSIYLLPHYHLGFFLLFFSFSFFFGHFYFISTSNAYQILIWSIFIHHCNDSSIFQIYIYTSSLRYSTIYFQSCLDFSSHLSI